MALAGVPAADLAVVERSLKREPVFESGRPRYCLLVFGPEATQRVWLVVDGKYLYADYCNGDVLGLVRNGNGASVRSLGAKVSNLSSFGQGPAGELYALSLSGGVFRLDPA